MKKFYIILCIVFAVISSPAFGADSLAQKSAEVVEAARELKDNDDPGGTKVTAVARAVSRMLGEASKSGASTHVLQSAMDVADTAGKIIAAKRSKSDTVEDLFEALENDREQLNEALKVKHSQADEQEAINREPQRRQEEDDARQKEQEERRRNLEEEPISLSTLAQKSAEVVEAARELKDSEDTSGTKATAVARAVSRLLGVATKSGASTHVLQSAMNVADTADKIIAAKRSKSDTVEALFEALENAREQLNEALKEESARQKEQEERRRNSEPAASGYLGRTRITSDEVPALSFEQAERMYSFANNRTLWALDSDNNEHPSPEARTALSELANFATSEDKGSYASEIKHFIDNMVPDNVDLNQRSALDNHRRMYDIIASLSPAMNDDFTDSGHVLDPQITQVYQKYATGFLAIPFPVQRFDNTMFQFLNYLVKNSNNLDRAQIQRGIKACEKRFKELTKLPEGVAELFEKCMQQAKKLLTVELGSVEANLAILDALEHAPRATVEHNNSPWSYAALDRHSDLKRHRDKVGNSDLYNANYTMNHVREAAQSDTPVDWNRLNQAFRLAGSDLREKYVFGGTARDLPDYRETLQKALPEITARVRQLEQTSRVTSPSSGDEEPSAARSGREESRGHITIESGDTSSKRTRGSRENTPMYKDLRFVIPAGLAAVGVAAYLFRKRIKAWWQKRQKKQGQQATAAG